MTITEIRVWYETETGDKPEGENYRMWLEVTISDMFKHKKTIEKIVGHEAPSDVAGFSNGNIVWICDDASEVALVHELYHSTSWVLEHFGIKDEETGAYVLAYLYKKSIGKFKEWQK